MAGVRKILVAFDGSPTSEVALKKAIELGGGNAKIYVLYVIDEDEIRWPSRIDISLIWDGNIMELEENILELHKKHAELVLEKAKKILKKSRKGRKAEFIYEIGFVPDEIIRKSEEIGADLIVMGSRSKSPIGFLLGSVAEKVVSKSKVPVLVVKDEVKSESGKEKKQKKESGEKKSSGKKIDLGGVKKVKEKLKKMKR